MNIPENILSKLTDEQKKRAEAAKSPEEFLGIAKEIGYELSKEQLDSMSGGSWCSDCSSVCSDCSFNCPDDYCPPVR